jgi:DNA modification methylase
VSIRLLHGHCAHRLRSIAEASIDACVTDPPYGLKFMGKKWDAQVPTVTEWREVYRVLKPGAHLLAFGGTRTYHRLVSNIEDAGFEIRDQLAWIFGSGFPKSLDVSKAIDKTRAEDIEPVRAICRVVRAAMDAKGLKSKDLARHFGDCHPRLIDHWAARDTDSQPSLPTWEQWLTLRGLLAIADSYDVEVRRLNDRKGTPGESWQNAEVVGEHEGETPGFGDHRFSVRDRSIRAPTDLAGEWSGWGTALKPAQEPIVLARKPLDGTVSENVQEHGTGALNIDGCRIAGAPGAGVWGSSNKECQSGRTFNGSPSGTEFISERHALGRWPANVLHDGSDEVVSLFPDEAGAAAPVHRRGSDKFRTAYGAFAGNVDEHGSTFQGDSGSAARFFYCAKASREDREDGLAHIGMRSDLKFDPTSAIANDGRRGEMMSRNNHPTVKPTDLMRWLCRLITPPGGTVLDPFMGSGSTGRGAFLEDFSFIGIEREAQWLPIAEARIRAIAPLFAPILSASTAGTSKLPRAHPTMTFANRSARAPSQQALSKRTDARSSRSFASCAPSVKHERRPEFSRPTVHPVEGRTEPHINARQRTRAARNATNGSARASRVDRRSRVAAVV